MSDASDAARDRPDRVGGPTRPGVLVRYWAGARHAAGAESDVVPGTTVGEVLDAVLARRPALAPVLVVASILVDGVAGPASARVRAVPEGAVVEILPPFAGG